MYIRNLPIDDNNTDRTVKLHGYIKYQSLSPTAAYTVPSIQIIADPSVVAGQSDPYFRLTGVRSV